MAGAARLRTIVNYEDENGKAPIEKWLGSLKDYKTELRIKTRINRMAQGNFGDHGNVGEGVSELRLFFGPGYRVYFAEDGDTVVVLLCGGDKSTQEKDIKKAKAYWRDYQERFK